MEESSSLGPRFLKTTVLTRICKLLLLICFGQALSLNVQGNVYRVGSDEEFQNIRTAIQEAADGDSILVFSGEYREGNLLVDKELSIIGIDEPLLDGENKFEIVTITSNHVLIRGFRIEAVGRSYMADYAAIHLKKVRHCSILNNDMSDTFFGIYAENSKDCLIQGNKVNGLAKEEATSGNAIHLWRCNRMTVLENHLLNNRDGIYFEFVEDSKIEGNLSEHNLRYGLHFMFSHSDVYTSNTFKENGAGVAVMYSNNVEMYNNRFEDNWGESAYGLLLKEIKESTIQRNYFLRNTIAIHMDNCLRLKIQENDFESNGWALRINASCEDNLVARNNFSSNTFEVLTNSSFNNNSFLGNYWSDYTGYDLDQDGFGDQLYRPVSLYSYLVSNIPISIVLLRSFFVNLLNVAERVTPVLTPESLYDARPSMKPIVFHD